MSPPSISKGQEWLPCTPYQTNEDDNCIAAVNECCNTLSAMMPNSDVFTPLQSRLKSSWNEATQKQKKQCINVVKNTCEMLCEAIAPLAKNELLKSLYTSLEEDSKPYISHEMETLMSAYKNATSKSLKTQILSIYVNWYPDKTLMSMHENYERITEWQIRIAKEHRENIGPGCPVKKSTKHRVRIDMAKVDHFLDFINRPYFYQDVAFGVCKLELENGEKLTMPNVVRTVTRSTMIAQYLDYCNKEDVEPLSRSTLYRILEVRKSSQRKSLQGLDNTAADGADAFDMLESIVENLEKHGALSEWVKCTRKSLKDTKRYLKTEFKVHCRESSTCADHCYIFALSDSGSKEFSQNCHDKHNTVCNECEKLKKVLDDIESKCKETVKHNIEARDDLLHDVRMSRSFIADWKAHVVRSENQDRAKQDFFKLVSPNTVAILIDWAMKFTQVKYREKQSEWYGKRGLNWHISSVLAKDGDSGKTQVTSYAHLFDSCIQDWFTVTSIIENLLITLKAENPSIERVYLRSDEAGCYHNNSIISALKDVSKRVHVEIVRYDFSEPQHGKDLCDRILCPMKASIRKYCNEGNDITTAAEMRNALKQRPVKGTTASVNTVNVQANDILVNKVDGFSAYHNFSYEEKGVRVWKAYAIGPGRLIPYETWQSKPQGPTLLHVEEGKGFFNPTSRRMLKESTVYPTEKCSYSCPDSECFAVFNTLDDLELHTEFGEHILRKDLGLYDQLKLDWISRFSQLTLDESAPSPMTQSTQITGKSTMTQGWALHKLRTNKRFSKDAKDYLLAKYNLGEKTGNKCDPQTVAKEMRTTRLKDGTRRFKREDWLTKSQIKSFFSRVTAARRKQGNNRQLENIDQDYLDGEEFDEIDENGERAELQDIIENEIGLQHPIIYDTFNLCEMYKRAELKNFNVKMLKQICSELEIHIKSKDVKAVIIEKLSIELSKCSCKQ